MTELLAPSFEEAELVAVGDWHPTRYTDTLTGTEDFTTQGDKLLAFAAVHWRIPGAARFLADPWQRWLVRRILETYPPDWAVERLRGQLRYRQVVISMARQNGKSLLGALLAFYFLTMHVRGPRVVSVASRDRQARIVYSRVKYVVDNSDVVGKPEALAAPRPYVEATKSRGMVLYNAAGEEEGIYQTLPNNEDAVQGEPITGGTFDELHIGSAGLWDALVRGASSKRNALLVGITTAGDDDSDLLIRLYDDGAAAIDGADERFGFFVWEAASDELTEANVIAANPSVACGRNDLDDRMAEERRLLRAPKDKAGLTGRDRVIRYGLNRFVQGSATSWASSTAWKASAGDVDLTGPRVFGLDRTDAWEWFTITAAGKTADGLLATELVAALEDTDHDRAVAACKALATAHPGSAFTGDRANLDSLLKALEEEGLEVWRLTAGETAAAAAGARAAIARRAVVHAGDPLVNVQLARGRKRNLADGSWRISRTLSTGDVDALLATVFGLHVANVRTERGLQLG